MDKESTYNSNYEEIGISLQHTLDEIKKSGETIDLKYDMLLKYGILNLMKGNSDKAYQVFQQCSIYSIDNAIEDVRELYYWTSRCLEELGKKEIAFNVYLMLLEKESINNNDQELIDGVLERLCLFGDISSLVNEYKNTRDVEANNPKSLLDKVIKNLRTLSGSDDIHSHHH